jgi:hypothetical protein
MGLNELKDVGRVIWKTLLVKLASIEAVVNTQMTGD